MKPIDTSPALPTERLKRIDRIIGKLLYYTREVDNTRLVPLSTMATRNDPTKQDEKNLHQFLDYMATYPNAVVIFHASDMILCADTESSYLNEPEARSCDPGCFFLGNIPSKCL